MPEVYTHGQVIEKINSLPKGEYENCRLVSCDFSEQELSGYKFIQCEFSGCNLSMAKLKNSAWQEVTFKDCKLLGLKFDTCNPFGFTVNMDNCLLSHSSFFRLSLKKMQFTHCKLEGVDFAECDLSQAVFDECDLLQATFDRTNLEKADFFTSHNYSIDPEHNRIRKARFSAAGLAGLLEKYEIRVEG